MNKIASQIIRGITELLGADRCTLYLVDKEHDQLVSKVRGTPLPSPPPPPSPLCPAGMAGVVWQIDAQAEIPFARMTPDLQSPG